VGVGRQWGKSPRRNLGEGGGRVAVDGAEVGRWLRHCLHQGNPRAVHHDRSGLPLASLLEAPKGLREGGSWGRAY